MAGKERLVRLAAYAQDLAYEIVVAALGLAYGCLTLWNPHREAAPAAVQPGWEITILGWTFICGGIFTIAGVLMTGLLYDHVGRTLGRRLEECGQILLAGSLVVPSLSAFSLGGAGIISGILDLGLAVAAVCRVREMRFIFRAATPEDDP